MKSIETTKMSSKGQVVIPETIRKNLNLKPGTKFVVVAEGDVLVFKSITAPPLDEYVAVIARARKQARQAGLTQADIKEAIARVRRKR